MPVTVNSRAGPSATIRTASPTAMSLPDAVAALTTTSPEPDAQWPDVSRSGLKRSCDGSTPKPKLGMLPPMTSPSRSRIFAVLPVPEKSTRLPAAASTPGRAWIRGRRSSETVGVPANAPSTTASPRTTRSVWV